MELPLTFDCDHRYSKGTLHIDAGFHREGAAMIESPLLDRAPPLNGSAEARHDDAQRDIVERGIAMQQSSNTMSAVEFLKSRDVGAQVIARVLLEPDRRRSNDA
jgi:hypothetical protein